jgi:hypothetical protein
MAYLSSTSTSPNVPVLQTQGIAGVRTWHYVSTHISSDIEAVNFFTDGLELGFKVGDQVIHHTSTGGIITSHSVLVVGSTTTDISVGTTIGLGS